ncbi:hypothetical protein EVAR_47300_1 [Eumeta japonica]|uniref:Uncharacterized protein n=1 Tax=Eumeta variegata TaxID=151549 RepID=A0A4C1YJV2_EUMVA|nr:hypothetical protein EVAR_47300_1 [Eumeta japonica]
MAARSARIQGGKVEIRKKHIEIYKITNFQNSQKTFQVFIETLPAEDHHRRLRPAHKVYRVPYIFGPFEPYSATDAVQDAQNKIEDSATELNGDTDQQQSSEGTTTEASSATTTTTTATTTEGNTDRTTTTDVYRKQKNGSERVLGLNWNSDRDELTFNLNLARLPHDIMNSERPTKRQVLKIVMSLFDRSASPHLSPRKLNNYCKKYGGERDGLRSSPLLASDRFSRSRFDITDNSQIESGAAQNHVDTETRTPGGRHGNQNGDHCYRGHDRKPNTKFYWTDSKTVLTWLRTALAHTNHS